MVVWKVLKKDVNLEFLTDEHLVVYWVVRKVVMMAEKLEYLVVMTVENLEYLGVLMDKE